MKTLRKRTMQVVASDDPRIFQDDFNRAMERLAEYEPDYEIRNVGRGVWAIITYTVVENVFDSVKDVFHAEGKRYICDQCPLHAEVKDRRVKMVACEHAPDGSTNREHECCEYYYTMLKEGKLDAPKHTVKEPVWRKGRTYEIERV